METKQQLVNSIREWVRIDNEMRKLKSETSKRKKNKKSYLNLLLMSCVRMKLTNSN
jgi:hypothetical protein